MYIDIYIYIYIYISSICTSSMAGTACGRGVVVGCAISIYYYVLLYSITYDSMLYIYNNNDFMFVT